MTDTDGSGDTPTDDHGSVAAHARIREILGHGTAELANFPDLEPAAPATVVGGRVSSALSGMLPDRDAAGSAWGPRSLVAVAVIFGLYTLRAERIPVAYPNDSAVHSLTVAFATKQIAAGHFPLDGWFPFLSLGSPFFLHYQSFSAVLGGLLGNIIGAPRAFSWSLYLGLAFWPVCVYIGARLFDLDRWTAATAAAVAPVIQNGITGYGFEHEAYIFYGSGLWSQLWGMLLLPIALGLAWRAVTRNQQVVAAGFALGGVIILHFLTAYLAGLSVFLFALLRPTQFLRRFGRMVVVGGISLLVSCFVLVPLIATGSWAATNEFEEHTYFDDSYGAKVVLSSLIHGRTFDAGHFPVVTIIAAVGFVVCVVRLRKDDRARALVGVFVLSLLLYFGRVTWGSLVKVLPDSSDLLFHRYVMGVQLFGVIFAGVGFVAIARTGIALFRLVRPHVTGASVSSVVRVGLPIIAIAIVVGALESAWRYVAAYDGFSGTSIAAQQISDATEGAQVNALIARVNEDGGGRVFAGLASDTWAYNFRVGSVPLYIYLADEGVDAVGFTLRTSSLTTDPEAYFDEYVAGDYELFGIHYLIYPSDRSPGVPANLIERQGSYDLYSVASFGLVHVVDTSGTIVADGTDLGAATKAYLQDADADKGLFDTIAYGGRPAALPTANPDALPTTSPGTVLAESDDLAEGKATTTVRMNRQAVVILSASFDPGWRVTVDGHPATPEMVVPAIVGVTVGPGIHSITFVYQAYRWYPELIAISLLTVVIGIGYEWRRRRLARRGPAVSDGPVAPANPLIG